MAALREARRRALIPYLTAGYPSLADTDALLDAYADAGADVIEIGVPFSDPVADGPTIQRSSQRALEAGATLAWTIERIAAFRARATSDVVVFSYLNPIIAYGADRFIRDAVDAGAAGVLVTDLPVGADDRLEHAIESSPLALIRLIAPTTPAVRIDAIAARAQGFLYYIARLGVTGASSELRAGLASEIARVRRAAAVPVAVGFGISSAEQAAVAAAAADGIIIGSALIDAVDRGGIPAAAALLASMRTAIDAARP
jgi:tryptophan synthase alpha chain